jgi:hypothetical protein
MSFTRTKYDNEAYDLRMDRSIAPGDYRLFIGNNENCEKCLSFDGPRNAKSDVSISDDNQSNQWGSMAEVESHLTNRVNKLTETNIYGKNDYYKKFNVTNKNNCNDNIVSEDTRFTFPLEAYRSMDLTAYHYTPFIHVNGQCEIQDDRIGLNSRLRIKDTFVVQRPSPMDQTNTLPPLVNMNVLNAPVDVCKTSN